MVVSLRALELMSAFDFDVTSFAHLVRYCLVTDVATTINAITSTEANSFVCQPSLSGFKFLLFSTWFHSRLFLGCVFTTKADSRDSA